MKKVLAFDMDDTLTDTKTPVTDKMAKIIGDMLDSFDVCIVSGASFEQFKIQMVSHLNLSPTRLRRLHLMPTCGTRYYRYNETNKDWELQYSEDLTDEEAEKITDALEKSAKKLDLWPKNPKGAVIENRSSQVTFTGLGHDAEYDEKQAWDPDGSKRLAITKLVHDMTPEFEASVAGTTSIDVTRPGINKAYGISKLVDILDISLDDILFFGDKLKEGGNDYPVKALGTDTIEVNGWKDTAVRLETILAVTK